MRTLRIIGALLVGLALMLAPTTAAHAAPGGTNLPTDVVITKIKLTDMTGWPKTSTNGQPITGVDGSTYNGGQIGNITGFFGAGATTLPGVTFKYYQVTATQYATLTGAPASYDTVDEVNAYLTLSGAALSTGTAVTDANGQVTFASLANGYYWFIEDLTATDAPLVNAATAVPFGLQLPMVKADGSYWGTGADALHVYPKNTTGNTPTVDKDVTTLGNDSDSANVGDPVQWIIKPNFTTVSDIATYQDLKFTDNIDSKLNYVPGSVVVTLNGGTVDPADYTVTEPASTSGGTLIVEFKQPWIGANLTPTSDLQVKFQTTINATAVVGSPIPNDVTLDFTNGSGVHGTPVSVPPPNQPEVWTGGKRFEKVIEGSTTGLAGAVFTIQPVNGTTAGASLVWTDALIAMNRAAIDAGKFATCTGTAPDLTCTPTAVGANPTGTIYVLSSSTGTFEIAGLQGFEPADPTPCTPTTTEKCNTETHPGTYQLTEVVAPAGYAMQTASIAFTVTKTSYWQDPAAVTPVATDPQLIANKKITIPATGGIGTIIFTLAGLAIMGGAAYGMRKRASAKA